LKISLSLFFSFIYLTTFANIRGGEVDSLKNLVGPLQDQTQADTLTINRLNKLAAGYFQSNPDSAYYFGHKSVSLSRKIHYSAGIADGLLQTGHVNYFKGRSAEASKDFDEAILIYKKLNDLKGLSACYMSYGRMYTQLANYKLAFTYANQALDILLKIQNERLLTDCYKNIGIIYFSQGELSKALDFYYKALFIAVKNHYKIPSAEIYNDIGVVLQNMEVFPKALEYFKKSLDIFAGTTDIQAIGTLNENVGEILLAQGNYDRAISYLNKSIKIAKKQDDKDGMSSVYTDLGLCYAHKRQFKLAIAYLDTSLQIASKYKITYNQAYTLIGFATLYNLQKDYKNALKYGTEGQKFALKLGNLSVRANAALQLNNALAGLGKFDEAYQQLNQYIDLKGRLKNNESLQKLTSYNFELNFAAKERQLAEQQHEKDLLYQQKIHSQRLINAIFLIIILAMIVTSGVYYLEKRKQQKINTLLEDKNHEVLKQKADLDEQAQKLNELNTLKDRLISVLAHDLRAPLSTLRGLFSLLQDDTITHQQLLDMIPNVLKKLEYTSDFLDTLLFWINSQMENFDSSAKSFSIKDIVAYETESYHEQALLKGISLIDNVPANLAASADPNSIRIVIRNLITNALKFSEKDDTIEISASKTDTDHVLISIKDTGIGMSADQHGKLFKSKVDSKTGTNNESGTGMGMLFCKDLVEKCNGKIWVTSEQGIGTEFSFTVPAGVLTDPDNLVLA
jgi:two-component system sensor histidine kinase/response regulator